MTKHHSFQRVIVLVFSMFFVVGILHAQSQKISVDLKQVSLLELFTAIEQQTSYKFTYRDGIIDTKRDVTISLKKVSVEAILQKVLSPKQLDFTINTSNSIVVFEKNTTSAGIKTKQIWGTVFDEKGEAIIGANVFVKNTSTGAITDMNGHFSLLAEEGNIISVTYIGYSSKEIKITDQSTYKISLAENLLNIDEVVVVGYGRQNRKDVTGAVTSLKSSDMNIGVITNPSQMLQGKVPGLNITRSGNPNDGGSMTLRGPSTLRGGANTPFYVIDGVPGVSIDVIAPEDIESIDVLRDASSTAIYGSRAANGVIMVTTRRAKEGERNYVSYSGYAAVESVSNSYEMMTGDELRAFTNNTIEYPLDDDGVSNTDWQKEVLRTTISTNHNLSFGGSGKSIIYGASLNYMSNPGIIKATGLERFIFRSNVEQKFLQDHLTLGLNLSHSNSTSDQLNSLLLQNMLQFLPTIPVRLETGEFSANLNRGQDYGNPLCSIENDIRKTTNSTTLVSGFIRAQIIEGLNFNLSYSTQRSDERNNYYYSSQTQNPNYRGKGGYAIRNSYITSKDIIEGYANYDKTFHKHDLKVMLGYSWQQDKNGDGFQTANSDFVSDDLLYKNLALGKSPDKVSDGDRFGGTVVSTLRMISFYGRANYQFDNRYLAQVTVRQDGSSAFGKNNRWGTFPSFSVGWKITNEAFMQTQKTFSDLRLRASYGLSGNSLGFDPMISRMKYGKQSLISLAGQDLIAIGPTQNANPDLKWETTSMLNIGLDFGFFNNRLTGTLEFYNKITNDLIWDYSVPTTEFLVGYLLTNVGKMSNRGVELTLNGHIIENHNFQWNSTLTLSHNRNRIEKITNDRFKDTYRLTGGILAPGQSNTFVQIIKENETLGTFYLPFFGGYNEHGETMFIAKDGSLTAQPTTEDYHQFTKGTAQPTLIFGWQNSFTYKNFDLSFFLRGVTGNYILNSTRAYFHRVAQANQFNILKEAEIEHPGDPRAHFVSDKYIENGSYIRLENATLGYTFNFNRAIKNLRLYVTGNNLFCLTSYKGIDPEISLGGIEPGIDNRNFYPKTRSVMFGIIANF